MKLSKRQIKKNKEQSLDILDKMIGELKHTRAAIEYDKKVKPYFYMINYVEDGKLGTHTLGSLDMFTIIGILHVYINSVGKKK